MQWRLEWVLCGSVGVRLQDLAQRRVVSAHERRQTTALVFDRIQLLLPVRKRVRVARLRVRVHVRIGQFPDGNGPLLGAVAVSPSEELGFLRNWRSRRSPSGQRIRRCHQVRLLQRRMVDIDSQKGAVLFRDAHRMHLNRRLAGCRECANRNRKRNRTRTSIGGRRSGRFGTSARILQPLMGQTDSSGLHGSRPNGRRCRTVRFFRRPSWRHRNRILMVAVAHVTIVQLVFRTTARLVQKTRTASVSETKRNDRSPKRTFSSSQSLTDCTRCNCNVRNYLRDQTGGSVPAQGAAIRGGNNISATEKTADYYYHASQAPNKRPI